MSHLSNIQNKIVELQQLRTLVNGWKQQGEKVVFTNGCFDIVHRGHVEYLAEAANCGDKLIVAINSDDSVKRQGKGALRPLQDEYARMLLIAGLEFVDAVVLFDDDTPYELVKTIIPSVLIKGGDYDPDCDDQNNKKYIVGSDVVKQNGGEVKVIQFVPGYSTSKIEEKIINGN